MFVGKAMYYVSKIAAKCANAVWELLQHMTNPGEEHWKAMDCFCGYIRKKERHKLVYQKPCDLRVISYADSDYATNTDTRRSVTGNINMMGGKIMHWRSKTQTMDTLLSTEAEYVALATCAQETMFMQMFLDKLVDCMKLGIIYEDNTRVIFLVRNSQVGMRTKHIDVQLHYLRELCKMGLVKVLFVPSAKNLADIMTKNVSELIFGNLVPDILNGSLACMLEGGGQVYWCCYGKRYSPLQVQEAKNI